MKSFIQLPKHKEFDYKPWFYNPYKDYVAERRKALGLTEEVEKLAGTGGMLRNGAMRLKHSQYKPKMEDDSRMVRVRRLFIMGILVALAYYFVTGNLDTIIGHLLQSK
ncbi:MAG: hypothetical protein ACI35Q_07495 [Marinilabiliaceae bacterium]